MVRIGTIPNRAQGSGMNIVETIERETRRHAAKIAVFEGDLCVTYKELI